MASLVEVCCKNSKKTDRQKLVAHSTRVLVDGLSTEPGERYDERLKGAEERNRYNSEICANMYSKIEKAMDRLLWRAVCRSVLWYVRLGDCTRVDEQYGIAKPSAFI